MIYTEMTKKALKLSFEAHKDRMDKGGSPYVYHPFHLAEQMTNEDTVITALLHDIVEDSDYTLSDLQSMGFNKTVCDALALLTYDGKEPYLDYIARIKDNPVAKAVKLADLRHNSDMTRLDNIDEKALSRAEKYRSAIALLTGAAALKQEIRQELETHIIPFWDSLCDYEKGGFYGYMDSALGLDKNAPKGVILHSRILWFYSNCYLTLGRNDCLEKAKHAFDFLNKYCVDRENGGVYWMVNADGTVNDDLKHTYCQSFFIYAMSSYYDASGDKAALDLAMSVFDTVETKCTDEVAYLEAQSREFKLVPNEFLSENGVMADKTMNTVLHLTEAYTELYRVSKDARVLSRLKFLLDLTYDKIYDKENSKLFVFFDRSMNVLGDIHSYGHDIEATWLLDRACDIINDPALTAKITSMNEKIVAKIADVAFENGALNNQRVDSEIDKWRVWWVQAETVVGFLNAVQRYGEPKYRRIAEEVWQYIKENIVDKRQGGEWHSQVNEQGVPDSKPVVEPWKCPYHNGRMCLEVINREA